MGPAVVSNTIQRTGCQIAFQAARQAESAGRLGEMDEYILDDVFGGVGIARQYDGQLEQMAMILVINPSQGVAIAPLESPDKPLIFHYPITHQKREFYIGFLENFSEKTDGRINRYDVYDDLV